MEATVAQALLDRPWLLLRLLVLPPPRRDVEHVLHWSSRRRHHQHRARTCQPAWHAYANTTP
ncbi:MULTISPECIES: hypothetical protein [unclassified Streptomyces]|uniref:hypothetical protein n=1 Tax=unclassified Streptomyces TaxID=2593676 RepID=UPI0035DA10D0